MFEKFKQGISPVFLLPKFSQDHHYRMVRFEMVMTLIVMATCAAIQSFDYTSAQAQIQSTPEVIQVTATENVQQPAAAATTTSRADTPVSTPASTPTVPSCRPAAKTNSTMINLGSYAEGVTTLRDSPQYYQVFGDDQSTVRSQIANCGPAVEYAADARYNLNWSYALRADETGLCQVIGIKVGVRTSMVLPYREVSGSEAPGLVGKWTAFSAALTAHENGHVAIAEQYAAHMLYSLQTFPAGDCYTMSPSVDATANSVAAQLRAAQTQYDTLTRHGATQGAVF